MSHCLSDQATAWKFLRKTGDILNARSSAQLQKFARKNSGDLTAQNY